MKYLISFLFFALSLASFGQDGKFVETNGVKLYYEIHGQGEPLLLLHGLTMTHDMWTPWLVDLTQTYKVILVDLRGHGESSNPTDLISHKELALDVYGLLDELNIDKVNAMGFSTGGLTLIHMATMQTDRIKSLILIGASPYYPIESRDHMKKITYENVSENNPAWIEYMKSVQPGGEEQIRKLLKVYTELADSIEDMNFTPPYLSTINSETLIIHGDQDPFFSVDIPVVLHEAIPKSYLWIVPNFKHNTPQKGTPLGDIFLSTITEFLKGNWDD